MTQGPKMSDVANVIQAQASEMVGRAIAVVPLMTNLTNTTINERTFTVSRTRQTITISVSTGPTVALEALPDGAWWVTTSTGVARRVSEADLARAVAEETSRLVTNQGGGG